MFVKFKTYLENAERESTKDILMNFLRSELGIDDENTILSLSTKDLSSDIRNDLINRGGLNLQEKPEVINSIKNGITVEELIDMLTDTKPDDIMPSTTTTDGIPN